MGNNSLVDDALAVQRLNGRIAGMPTLGNRGKGLNSDGKVPISRNLGTERLCIRGALAARAESRFIGKGGQKPDPVDAARVIRPRGACFHIPASLALPIAALNHALEKQNFPSQFNGEAEIQS
jgi:hypothetical protein